MCAGARGSDLFLQIYLHYSIINRLRAGLWAMAENYGPPATESAPVASSTSAGSAESKVLGSNASSASFFFAQIHRIQDKNESEIFPITESQFLEANFSQICPSQNCTHDCRNMSLVFNASPAGPTTGSSDSIDIDVPVTLFGICSNMANASDSAERSGNARVQSFFAGVANDTNTFASITSDLTTCLSTSCDKTRKPSECVAICRPDYLLADGSTNLGFESQHGLYQCAKQLCSSTCGLPYANQDVFGIGVGSGRPPPSRLSNYIHSNIDRSLRRIISKLGCCLPWVL